MTSAHFLRSLCALSLPDPSVSAINRGVRKLEVNVPNLFVVFLFWILADFYSEWTVRIMTKRNGIRLTDRDLKIAKWIAEQQAVRLDTIARLLEFMNTPCGPRNLRRLAERWEEAGLVHRQQILADVPMILWPTKSAMRLTDFDDKRIEKSPSITTLHHTLAVSRVRLAYEMMGSDWTPERALRQKFNGQHLADGLATIGQRKALIEVELTRKKKERLRNIISSNARTPGIEQVHYWTTPELHAFVTEEIANIHTSIKGQIYVYQIPSEVL